MANQPTDKDKPGAIHKGLADEIVFEGHPGTKSKHEPKLAGAFKQGIGAALARLMADPGAEAESILSQGREHAFQGELAKDFPTSASHRSTGSLPPFPLNWTASAKKPVSPRKRLRSPSESVSNRFSRKNSMR